MSKYCLKMASTEEMSDLINCHELNLDNQNLTIDINLKQLETQQTRIVDCYYDMNISNICRICLEKILDTSKMSNIFEISKQNHFSLMIMACASVQIIEGDGLPSMICEKCIENLNIAYHFKQQCESSDMKLRHYFDSSQHLQITPDLDGYTIGIKEEQNLFHLQQNTLVLSNNQIEQTPIDNSTPIINNISHNANVENVPTQSKVTTKKYSTNKEPKQHQCDTCGKIFKRREYLVQHIRTHTGEKPYRCHLCEKRFVNSGHLATHMRTHTGERPHACSLCPKAFNTKQELNKHSMVHRGERPFICKICGRNFGSSSNLYSHLRHHTGEKNFTCEHCGKAFYTKQELKQHLVVHTGEKAFLCDVCNKRFSQIAHLKRHSKLHCK